MLVLTHVHPDHAGAVGCFDQVWIGPGCRHRHRISDTILPSITNNSLQRLAEDLGFQVVTRPVPVEDLAEFEEVNACGTAIVLRPIHKIDDRPAIESEILTESYTFGAPDKCGSVSQKLYNCIRDIQEGREEDIHNWCLTIR